MDIHEGSVVQHWIPVALLMALWASLASADAVTIFRVVAPDGTVTYQDQPPKQGGDETVEAREIDTDANVVPIERFPTDAEYTTPTRPAAGGSVTPSATPRPLAADALVKGAAASAAPAAPPAAPAVTPAPPTPPPPVISPSFRGP